MTLERWAGWTVPTDYRPESIGRCRGCGALVLWCATPSGKRSPHDRDGVSHFATCPEAARFRRVRRAARAMSR